MRYVANPVIVEAHKIVKVENSLHQFGLALTLETGEGVFAGPDMTARYMPVEGDYWVIQEDGYIYVNPKAVFERKYRAERPKTHFSYMQPADKPVIEELKEFEVVYAKEQPEYIPLRTLRGRNTDMPVLSRWSPTPQERAALADGADIFLELLTFGGPLQPIVIYVADEPNYPDYFRERFRLPKKIQDTKIGQAFKDVAGEISEAMKSQKPGSHDVREPEKTNGKAPGPHNPPKPPVE